jgi:tetratricopeptide (TPR) repeat protein
MGFIEFRAGHLDDARKWYEQAVKLDSQSYLSHYYFAAISMNDPAHSSDDTAIEASLRAAIKLNPSFAPPFERLAALEGERHRNLDEAHMMTLMAAQLDPGNVHYRMTAASVLMEMDRSKDAIAVLHAAMRLAKTPQETSMVQSLLGQIENFTAARDRQALENQRIAEEIKASGEADSGMTTESSAKPEAPEEIPKGPHHFLVGTLQNVHCHTPRIDLTVDSKGKTTPLHSGNYYQIAFSALGFTPIGELDPCNDLEGKPAKVEYIEPSAKPAPAYVVAIEIHK